MLLFVALVYPNFINLRSIMKKIITTLNLVTILLFSNSVFAAGGGEVSKVNDE